MEHNNIEKIIEKYFDGNTTLQEEQSLRSYFQQNEVAPQLEVYRSYFGYLDQEKKPQFEKQIRLPQKNTKKYSWSLVAAIVIISGISLIYENQKTTYEDLGTFDDPELAIQETQKALQLVSKHLNKGMEQTKHLETFNQSKKLIFKKQ